MKTYFSVYLSSTLKDLEAERQAVREVLNGFKTCKVIESYSADERSVRESCLADVADCDLYIGILGGRYGYIQPGETDSITELEYNQASDKGIPRLIFIKELGAITLPNSDAFTRENEPERIDQFRQRVTGGSAGATRPDSFSTPEELRVKVTKAYYDHINRNHPITPKPPLIKGSPYPGLRAFNLQESDRFFGRDLEIEALQEQLLISGKRFIAVFGASGSGKSSLVYAGLLPRLKALNSPDWQPICFTPRGASNNPFAQLAEALLRVNPKFNLPVWDLAQQLQDHPTEIASILGEILTESPASVAGPLWFVDQFEEVFAVSVAAPLREAFFQLLLAAVTCERLRIVITMRSDFYSQWPQDPAMIALLQGHFAVGIPGRDALKEMIVRPAEAAGLNIAPRLVQRILDDTGSGPGSLALAEYALSQLYEQKDHTKLTEAAYTAIGGVAGSIDRLAEGAVLIAQRRLQGRLDDEAFSNLFLAIASVEQRSPEQGEALTVVRRRAAQQEFTESALILASCLVDRRILVSHEGGRGHPVIYEVGHEAVFSHWQRFKNWFERYADDLALRRQAEQAAREWQANDQSTVLKWDWERQYPVIEALRKLQRLAEPQANASFSDPRIVTWSTLGPTLTPPLHAFLYPEPLALLEALQSDTTPHHRREEIGLRLNQIGDPRRGIGLNAQSLPDIDWVEIPAGEVTLETEAKHRFEVATFHMARYPITWAQYMSFIQAENGYANPDWWNGLNRVEQPGDRLWAFANYPAINVSWFDAVAFCRWLSAQWKLSIRLPTEWEWQWAASGSEQRSYPWGNAWNAARANSNEAGIGRTVAVGLYPLGCSPYGLEDMVGNAWEWCLNEYVDPNHCQLSGDQSRVLRGGSWFDDANGTRSAARYGLHPGSRRDRLGFRVVCVSSILE